MNISDLLALVASQHADKPKFIASLTAVLAPSVALRDFLADMPAAFDLDVAVGAQLDVIGLWVGVSRVLRVPLTGVYFSFDIAGLGFNQGTWLGPFDSEDALAVLPDEFYRVVIRAKIAANGWDGRTSTAASALELVFPPDDGYLVVIQDYQNMSMLIGVAGTPLDAVRRALLADGYIPLKPMGVRVDYAVPSEDETPFFGFDLDTTRVAGFDEGSFAEILNP